MGVRAKFVVAYIEEQHHSHQTYKKVRLEARYDPSVKEDQGFTKATPSGHLEMVIDNPAALEQLVPGKAFYIDLTPCE